jgi:hypothetical protein
MNMKKIIILFFLFVGFVAASNVSAIPVLWGANGHYYEVIQYSGQTWDSARAQAQAKGAGWDLATITSPEEQNFIANLLGTANPSGSISEYWIGGYQGGSAGEPGSDWMWVTGESFNLYLNWGTGEPNDVGGEDHLAMDDRYLWGWNDNDPSLYAITGYVAEKHTPVPEPISILLFGTGLVGIGGYVRRKFKR